MRALWLIPAFALLAACAGQEKRTTFTCPNGPSLVVNYTDTSATLVFPGNRVEVLSATETEGLYASPGVVWEIIAFRSARLSDGDKSYNCDQMAG